MTRRDEALPLRQMLGAAREAVDLARGKRRADLETERVLQLALARLLSIIGHAAAGVPKEVRERHREIPFSQSVNLRDRLLREYDTVVVDTVWQPIQSDLPTTIRTIEKALENP